MVTTTAPPPFLARISAGTEDPRRLPSALLQRLRRGDSNCENQPSCCTAGPGGSARPAVKRVRRKKGKIRPSAAGLLPSRYQQYQQHRAGLGRRTPLGTHGPGELRAHPAPTASAAPGMVTTPPEEPPAPVPSRPAPGKPLRKEVKRGLRHFCSLFAPPPPNPLLPRSGSRQADAPPFPPREGGSERLAPSLRLLRACGRAGGCGGGEFPLRRLGRGGAEGGVGVEREKPRAAIGCSAPPMGARRCAQQQPDLACWPPASRPCARRRDVPGAQRPMAAAAAAVEAVSPPPAERAVLPALRLAGAGSERVPGHGGVEEDVG